MGAGIVQILIQAKDMTAAAFATTRAKLALLKGKVVGVQGGFVGLGSKISSVMAAAIAPIMLVVAAVYAIGSAVGTVVSSFSDMDTAMKGVQKTTGMTDEEVADISDDFKEMSKTVPKSAVELANIGRIAGQLGIEGAEDITTFTKVAAEASIAFDIDEESAALGLAALVKIYGISIPETVNMGSAVNELGNTTGATEAQILTFGTSLGPTAEMLGFTAGEALGMGATLIELKIDASDAGTRINSALTMMGQKLPHVAELLGISEEAFKDAFGADPLGMLIKIIDKVKEIEDPLDQNTKLTQIFGRIGAKAMRGLAKDTGRLTENVETATDAYEDGTAMHEEYLIFLSSFASQMDLIENKVNLAAIAVGEKLAPVILALGKGLTDTVIPGFATLAEEVGKQTEESWPEFKTAVSEAFAALVGDDNIVTWQNIMETLGRGIGAVLNGILEGLTLVIEIATPFLEAIGRIIEVLAKFVSDVRNLGVKEAFSNLKTKVFAGLGSIKDKISEKVAPIVDKIVKGLGETKDKVRLIFEDVKTTIFGKLGGIKDEIGAKIAPIVSAIKTAFELAKGVVGIVFDAIKDTAIYGKLATIAADVGAKVTPIITAIETAFKVSIGIVGLVFDAIKDTAIYGKLAEIATGVGAKALPIVTAIKDAFAGLVADIGAIFNLIGDLIIAFGEKMPGFLGTGITDLGNTFNELGDAFTAPSEDIKADIMDNIVTPLSTDIPAAAATASDAIGSELNEVEGHFDAANTTVSTMKYNIDGIPESMGTVADTIGGELDEVEGHFDAATTTVSTMKSNIETVPASVKGISDATGNLEEEVKEDLDKVTLTVDGVEVSFDGLKGKVDDVVTEFGNFEDIAGDLIGLDWGVFTTLKEDLPKIDKGIGDMRIAFGGLKDVLDDNIDNLADIQTDLGDIEKVITPFVNNISPGINAVGTFGQALSDTHSALSTFASMSEIDMGGMLGFEGAVHSMTDGLKILKGQVGRLMPKFGDLVDLSNEIATTFISGSKAGFKFEEAVRKTFSTIKRDIDYAWDLLDILMELGYTNEEAQVIAEGLISTYNDQFRTVNTTTEAVEGLMRSEEYLAPAIDIATDGIKNQTLYLTKISGAIQPLIDFMGTLNELYASVFGEKAAVWDMTKVQEVFGAIEDTVRYFGDILKETDFGKFIGEAVDKSGDFIISMQTQGSEFNLLTNYIGILLEYYVELAELMGRLTEAEEEMGDAGFEASHAFDMITDYVTTLVDYLPELSTGLSTLNDGWKEHSEVIMSGMTAFLELRGVLETIGLAMVDFSLTMVEVAKEQQLAVDLGLEMGTGFELITSFVNDLTGAIPGLATELKGLNVVWNKNNETVNRGAKAFIEAMTPIQTVGESMIDFSKIMVVAELDVGGGFNKIIEYISRLTDFTPILASALSNLKDVWDDNSGAIGDGITAFQGIIDAIGLVQDSMGDWITAENDAQTATEDATAAVEAESDALAGSSLTTSAEAAAVSVGILTGATGELVSGLGSVLSAINAVASALSGSLIGAVGNAISVINSLAGSAYSAGAAFGNSFADGIYSAMGAVEGAAGALAGVVASYLEVHSNTELGALSELMDWGPNIVKALEGGIRGEMNSLNKALNEITLGGVSMTSVVSGSSDVGGGTKNVYMTINQNISSKTDADYAIKEIERLMKKPQIL